MQCAWDWEEDSAGEHNLPVNFAFAVQQARVCVERISMREGDIRRALIRALGNEHAAEPDTIIMDELTVCRGVSRVDVAVINGKLHGFEIKSEQDTLARLPGQIDSYCQVFDSVTLVATESHLEKLLGVVPAWCGVWLAKEEASGSVSFCEHRAPDSNPGTVPSSVAELLWRCEALEILERHGLAAGLKSKPKKRLWSELVAQFEPICLAREVRCAIKARQGWRADARRLLNDESTPPFSSLSHCQSTPRRRIRGSSCPPN